MGFELELIKWLQSFSTDFLDSLFKLFTIFGEEESLIVLLGFIYWCYDKKIGELMGLTIFVSLGLNSAMKLAIARPRPFMVDDSIVNLKPSTSTGYSFPSGHTQTASTTYFSLYYLIKKKWLLIVAIIITLLVALSRMYLGVHYLTDVLTAWVLGVLLAYFIAKKVKEESLLKKIYKYLAIASIVGFIVVIVINIISNTIITFRASDFYFDTEALAKMLGTLTGFSFAILYEKKKVNFTNIKDPIKNIFRFLLGLAVILAIRYALKFIFGIIVDTEALVDGQYLKSILGVLFDFIRYFTMLFIGIGVYPIIFKKINI
ncbi:phosphatase PAP2 family protein [Candidatus Izemoplasma sp. B36]|uniref:phosphatase PAP2 family protein n=1 Tax=Candidatus Izemoplasma sp. B36 TaxID=3242468 RepID=UPI003556E989